jgi:hypothetical protein
MQHADRLLDALPNGSLTFPPSQAVGCARHNHGREEATMISLRHYDFFFLRQGGVLFAAL